MYQICYGCGFSLSRFAILELKKLATSEKRINYSNITKQNSISVLKRRILSTTRVCPKRKGIEV